MNLIKLFRRPQIFIEDLKAGDKVQGAGYADRVFTLSRDAEVCRSTCENCIRIVLPFKERDGHDNGLCPPGALTMDRKRFISRRGHIDYGD